MTPCPLSDRIKSADGCFGTRGSKVGREHRTKSPELGFKPPLLLAGSQAPLGLSFLRIELRMLGAGRGGLLQLLRWAVLAPASVLCSSLQSR